MRYSAGMVAFPEDTSKQEATAAQNPEQAVIDAVNAMISDGDIAGICEGTVSGATKLLDLDLDSLTGIELVTRVETNLGRRLGSPEVLQDALSDAQDGAGTVSALAEEIGKVLAKKA